MSDTPVTTQAKSGPPPSIWYETATNIGIGLGVVTVILGALLGEFVPGLETTDGGYFSTETLTSYTTGTTGDGGFNWLLFSIFAAAGLVCLTIGLTVACITKNMPAPAAAPPAPASTDPGYAA